MDKKNMRKSNLLSHYLLRNKETFTKKENKIIDYINANPHEVVYLSLAELAQKTQTSDITIIRLCKKIDLSGYAELKIVIAQSFPSFQEECPAIEEIKKSDSVKTVVSKESRRIIDRLQSGLKLLRIKNIEAAADSLISATRILIFARGNSGAVALDFQQKLLRIGIHAEIYADSHLYYVAVANIKPSDVLFVISHAGVTNNITDAIKIAKNIGASVLSLTQYALCPVYNLSDIRLYVARPGEEHPEFFFQASRIGEYAIIDILYAVIVQKNWVIADKASTNVKKALLEEEGKNSKKKKQR
jgi:DNA-binding MurR/RpiR family transcriptional regulator